MVALAVGIARELGVPEADIEHVATAMHLCDIGNVAVPRAVLGYPGKITGPEWQFIHLHTLRGRAPRAGPLGMTQVARPVRHSHERWTGYGYPDGLAGKADARSAPRIVSVCSAFRNMTSDRPHHAALHPLDALARLNAARHAV